METMKAAFIERHGKAEDVIKVRETPRPDPMAEDVLIKVEAFGLNFADVLARKGLYREAPAPPFIPGYDVVGEIIKVGTGVAASLIGKRVVALTRFKGYAEYVVTKAVGVTEVPADLEAHEATALATQYCTAYYASSILTNVLEGDNVLIHSGAGGVGTALVQLCKIKGANAIVTVGSKEKAQTALTNGAVHAILYKESDYASEVVSYLNGERLDISFNAVAGSTFKKDLKLLGSGGRLVLYGAAERTKYSSGTLGVLQLLWKMGLVLPILLMAKSRSLLGINMLKVADHRPMTLQKCMSELMEMVETGKLQPASGMTIDISDLQRIHTELEDGMTQGKIAVKW